MDIVNLLVVKLCQNIMTTCCQTLSLLLTFCLYLTAIHFFSELKGISAVRKFIPLGSSIPSCSENKICTSLNLNTYWKSFMLSQYGTTTFCVANAATCQALIKIKLSEIPFALLLWGLPLLAGQKGIHLEFEHCYKYNQPWKNRQAQHYWQQNMNKDVILGKFSRVHNNRWPCLLAKFASSSVTAKWQSAHLKYGSIAPNY